MSYKTTASAIFKAVGGAENIKSATHCVTRLRIILKDEDKVDDNVVKNIPKVIGVMRKNGQYQVILGNDVANYYKEFIKLGQFSQDDSDDSEKKSGNIIGKIIEYIAGSMTPLIPGLLGGGLLKVLVVILPLLGILKSDSQTITFLSIFGDAPYYFMPIFLAYSASIRLKVTPILGMAVAGVLLHPNFVSLVSSKTPMSLFGAPVVGAVYGSSVIPILIMVWLMTYIEKWVNKVIPVVVKSFLQPAIILIISGFIALVIVGPLGVLCGDALSSIALHLHSVAGWLTLAILGAIMPFIVMTGMHWAFAPIFLAASLKNPDFLILPAMLGSNLAQGAASMAVSIRSKKSETKELAFAAGFSALLAGITEPALYGISLKYKKPLYAVMIGGGIAGLYAGIVGLKSYTFIVPSIVGLPQFINHDLPSNFINAIIITAIAIVITFIVAYILGIDEEAEVAVSDTTNNSSEEQSVNEPEEKSHLKQSIKIYAPLEGELVSIEDVPDDTFAQKLMGEGVAIIPSNGKLLAPFAGKVTSIFNTKHAFGLTSDTGVELLIHVGIDTVELKGEGFTTHVKEGDTIEKGQLLMDIDLNFIKEKGYPIITPIIVTNTQSYLEVLTKTDKKHVTNDDDIIVIL